MEESIIRDKSGRVRHIEQIQKPFLSPSLEETTPEQLADQYLAEVAPVYQINDELADLSAVVPGEPTRAEAQLHRCKVKDVAGSTVVNYIQSYRGLPIWGADFSVHIAPNPMRVTSSSSTLHDSITLGNDPEKAAVEYQEKLKPEALTKLLGIKEGKGVLKINGMRLVIYQYDPDQRTKPEEPKEEKGASFEEAAPTLPLPPLPKTIEAGVHYVVAEVLFDLDLRERKGLHWLALIEPESEAVLYLRALVSAATGKVFRMDPISLSGDASLTPDAPDSSLNNWRASVPLDDLVVSNPQDMRGNQVDLQDLELPTMPEPTTTYPFDFSYAVKTEGANFAAVNAYYHVNWFFNLMKGMGFDLSKYFDGTKFPVPVDHWGKGGAVNAHCDGNATRTGIGEFQFGVAQKGHTVGIADDLKIVIHEFGHGLLWDQIHWPNFGFAHSAGDALAAILTDPTNIAPDRYLTFPWPISEKTGKVLDRRHDRKVIDGWGWFGNMYDTQYNGEQVLSTTLFRLYRSAGGDSPHAGDRAWASRYVSYLIIKAIGTLTNTTRDPTVFVTALMNADQTTTNFEGHPGGALHKVIRWAFEKQGLFQPNAVPDASTPVTKEGNPPDVDVYIDDGRHGEYQYQYAFWESQDMWVRRSPDGGTTHQEPIVGKPNYMYVRVKNRGTQTANNVVVKAYHCNPGAGLAWPDHWGPMDTPLLPASGPISSGGEVVVGPFEWKPEVSGHECLLAIASATGDSGNDTTVFSPIPHSRFVPFDNNIGQRNVCPVLINDWKKLPEYINKLPFQVVNPLKKSVKVELVPVLPRELSKTEYWIFFSNAGANKFELGPRENRKAIFSIVKQPRIPSRRPWKPLSVRPKPGILQPEEMLKEGEPYVLEESLSNHPIKFRIVTLIDGQNMGGMTYILQPKERMVPTREVPIGVTEAPVIYEEEPDIQLIIGTLSQQPSVKSVRLKKVNLDIEFKE